MADWLDVRIGGICKMAVDIVNKDIPFLGPAQKAQLEREVRECAEKADQEPTDTVTSYNHRVQSIERLIKVKTGKSVNLRTA